jgi:hypothetical protein
MTILLLSNAPVTTLHLEELIAYDGNYLLKNILVLQFLLQLLRNMCGNHIL